MSPVGWGAAGALGLMLIAPLGVHGVAYARAAASKRHTLGACPVGDDNHEALPPLRAVQLVVAESTLWLYVVATAALPPAETAEGASAPQGAVPLVVLAPPWLPRASVRLLVSRLRRDGFSVVCPRLAAFTRRPDRRLRALDEVLRTTWERFGARTVDVLAAAGSAADVAGHLADGGSGVPTVRRLITLGAAGGVGPRVPRATEVIAFYSHDDPFLGPVEQARRPGALNVAVRALGRLGLLHAPHVYTLLREHLLAPPIGHTPPWPSAVS